MKEWARESARISFKYDRSTGEASFHIGTFWIVGLAVLALYVF